MVDEQADELQVREGVCLRAVLLELCLRLRELDKDLYGLPPEEAAELKQVPGSLKDVIEALLADNEFLLKGDVFTPDLIEKYAEYKMTQEFDQVRLRPHPHEFTLYYGI